MNNFKSEVSKILSKDDTKKNKITEAFENMLCSKLIINKESNMLILKPYFCYEILYHLKTVNSVVIKNEIIEKLSWLVAKIHTNAFILTHKSILKVAKTQNTMNFINELIDLLIENNRENNFSETLLNFIEKVIYLSGLKMKYVKHAFEKILEMFNIEKYDGNKFVLILKLINVL